VGGHIEVQNTTPVMGQHQKHVKDLEADSWHREEVYENEERGFQARAIRCASAWICPSP
jgi:hypothetical protein